MLEPVVLARYFKKKAGYNFCDIIGEKDFFRRRYLSVSVAFDVFVISAASILGYRIE